MLKKKNRKVWSSCKSRKFMCMLESTFKVKLSVLSSWVLEDYPHLKPVYSMVYIMKPCIHKSNLEFISSFGHKKSSICPLTVLCVSSFCFSCIAVSSVLVQWLRGGMLLTWSLLVLLQFIVGGFIGRFGVYFSFYCFFVIWYRPNNLPFLY